MLITDENDLRKFSPPNRLWQGIPSVEVTEKGRIFAVFYSGREKETFGNYVVLLTSDDGGRTWTDPAAAAYSGEHSRCFDSVLWIDPRGRLWWCWSVMPVNSVWCSVCEAPDAEVLSWSAPRLIGGEVMMQRPTALRDGNWLFPLAVWRDPYRKDLPTTFGPEKKAFVYRTADEGKTFERLGGAEVPERTIDEHILVEKRDGSLEMYVRTAYGLGKSVSRDGGRSWSAGGESGIFGPDSRAHVRRLAGGRLLLVKNLDLHERNGIGCWLSEDDGESWLGPLVLDERKQLSYPDAVERGGVITVIYDRERGGFAQNREEAERCAREILLARVTEEEILRGRVTDERSFLKRTVSKLGAYAGPTDGLFDPDSWFI